MTRVYTTTRLVIHATLEPEPVHMSLFLATGMRMATYTDP